MVQLQQLSLSCRDIICKTASGVLLVAFVHCVCDKDAQYIVSLRIWLRLFLTLGFHTITFQHSLLGVAKGARIRLTSAVVSILVVALVALTSYLVAEP